MANATAPAATAATSLPNENMAAAPDETGTADEATVPVVVGAPVIDGDTVVDILPVETVMFELAVTLETITTELAVVRLIVEVINVLFAVAAVAELTTDEVTKALVVVEVTPVVSVVEATPVVSVVAYVVVTPPSTTQGMMSM